MCGIAGLFRPGRPLARADALAAMLAAIRHRGPDAEAVALIDGASGQQRTRAAGEGAREAFPHDVGLAHCRFSIVDPSSAAHQPFWSEDGAAVLTFNGEIYNHRELRKELESRGARFRTRSDTEVLLAAYREWGVDCFPRLDGFWALALYDLRRRRLLLARDRIGKSPLYHATHGGTLYWASEIKGIRAATGDVFGVRPGAVADFVHHGWRDLDHDTFYQGIRTLEPASWAWVDRDLAVRPQRYWSLPSRRLEARELPLDRAARELRELLEQALRTRRHADVGIAWELSGGMDSSSLVALRAAMADDEPVRAYTVRFPQPEWDESPYARAVAERFPGRIDQRVVEPPPLEFWQGADAFVSLMDEPFHSPNLLTVQSLRRMMRRDGFRVVVSGAAGDELLAGYDEYRMPFLRQALARGRWRELATGLAAGPRQGATLAREWLRGGPGGPAPHPLQRDLVTLPPTGGEPAPLFDERLLENWRRWKLNYWLRSGNTAMYGIPIEPRMPFLDHRLVEFAFRLPAGHLVHGRWHKYVLRRALDDLLPAPVAWRRRKLGFPFPARRWLEDSRATILGLVAGCEVDGLRADRLPAHYDALVRLDPDWLWRFVSVLLWHRRCHQQRPLTPPAAA